MPNRFKISLSIVVLLIAGMFSLASAAAPPNTGFIPVAESPDNEQLPAAAYSTASGTYLVAYQYYDGSDYHVAIRMYDSLGNPLYPGPLDLGVGHRFPAVAYNSLHNVFGVATAKNDAEIVMHWIAGNDQILLPGSSALSVHTSGDTVMTPAIAFNSNDTHDDFLIVWQEGVLGDWSLFGHRVTPASPFTATGSLITIAQTTKPPAHEESFSAPDVAYDPGSDHYLVVYDYSTSDTGTHPTDADIRGRIIHNDGTGPGPELIIDSTACHQYNPTVAAYGPNPTSPFFVAYEDYWNSPGCETEPSIRGIHLKQDGTLLVSPRYVNISATINTWEARPDIIASDTLNTYIVTWNKGSGSNWDIYAGYLRTTAPAHSSDQVMGPPVLISGDLPNERMDEDYPVVAGGWPTTFIIWHENGWSGGPDDVVGRIWGYQVYLPLVIK